MKRLVYIYAMLGFIFVWGCCCAMEGNSSGDVEQGIVDHIKVIGEDICPICQSAISEPATSDIPPYVDCTCCCGIKNVCLLGKDPSAVVIGKINEDPKRCNHKVHYRCLLGWQREKGNICPLCGAPSFCILEDPSARYFNCCQRALIWVPVVMFLGGVATYVCLFIVRYG